MKLQLAFLVVLLGLVAIILTGFGLHHLIFGSTP